MSPAEAGLCVIVIVHDDVSTSSLVVETVIVAVRGDVDGLAVNETVIPA